MKKHLIPFLALSYFCSCNMKESPKKMVYPETPTIDHVDTYGTETVADPYHWLEYDTAENVKAWGLEQSKVTDAYLSAIPYRKKIRQRVEESMDYVRYAVPTKDGAWLSFYKNDGLQNQPVLYVQKGLEGKAEVLLDPNKMSNDGTMAIQATSFSKNQKYFAYAVAAAGSDWQSIRIMDFKTRKEIDAPLEHVKFTNITWNGDEGFYYSGYQAPKDEALKYSIKTEYQKIYYHKIGTSQNEDKIVYEDKNHPLRYVSCDLTDDGQFLILEISEGTDGVEIKVKDLKKPNGHWQTIVPGFSSNAYVVTSHNGNLFLCTNEDAPNFKLVSLRPEKAASKANWQTIIPEQKNKMDGVSTAGGKLFVRYLKDVTSQVTVYDMDGTHPMAIRLPGSGTAAGFSGHQDDSIVFYSYTSYNYPTTIFKYNLKSQKQSIFYASESKFKAKDYETKQVFYTSKDGTKVPMFITHKKGIKLDGQNPTLLYAYGGFNISITPAFSATNQVFLENGGVYCVANIRGGSEYGEDWHRQAMFEKKQNVFDDFIAAAEYLIKNNYTSSEKLAIKGGSNGGLLVGACMIQRPDLYAVAIPQVGVLDMLRFQKFTVGWGWVSEYGSSDDPEQFKYLIKYSPLHNLKQGVCYPATLITTGDHDDRVVPAHSFKFAATLQKYQGCDHPALIRIDRNAGHGAGKPTSKIIDEQSDIWSFIFYNLGMDFKA